MPGLPLSRFLGAERLTWFCKGNHYLWNPCPCCRLILLQRRISSGPGAWLPWLVKRRKVVWKYGTFLHVVNPRKLACLSANAVSLPNMRVWASLGKLFAGFPELVECQCFSRFAVFLGLLSAAIQPISQGQRASFASSFGLFRTAKWPLLQPCLAQVAATKSCSADVKKPFRSPKQAKSHCRQGTFGSFGGRFAVSDEPTER